MLRLLPSHVKVNPSVENLTISNIMVEKFKALFMNPEAWTDVRRYNYDANVNFFRVWHYQLITILI